MHAVPTKKNSSHGLFILFLSLPICWLSGLSIIDISRIILGMIVILFLKYPKIVSLVFPNTVWSKTSITTVIVTILIFVPLVLNLRNFIGESVVDTQIFNQAAVNFANHGRFWVSLNRFWLSDFLADHVSPILIAPAFLYRLGIPAYSCAIFFQMLTTGLGSWCLFYLAKILKFDTMSSLAVCLIFLCLGPIRNQLTWNVQAEYMSFPFVVLTYYFWVKKYHWVAVTAAVLSWSCKETLACWSVGFGLFALAYDLIVVRQKSFRTVLPYLLLVVCGTAYFFGLVIFHEFIFGRSFDYLGRIDLQSIFESPKIFLEKIGYIVFFLSAGLFYFFWKKINMIFLLPILPHFIISFISNSSHMRELGREYALFPAMAVYIATITAFGLNKNISNSKVRPFTIPACAGVFVLALYFAFLPSKPMGVLHDYFALPKLSTESLQFIPREADVYVSLRAAPFLLDRHILYLYTARTEKWPEFDYLVIHQNELKDLTQIIKEKTRACFESIDWHVRCKLNATKP